MTNKNRFRRLSTAQYVIILRSKRTNEILRMKKRISSRKRKTEVTAAATEKTRMIYFSTEKDLKPWKRIIISPRNDEMEQRNAKISCC